MDLESPSARSTSLAMYNRAVSPFSLRPFCKAVAGANPLAFCSRTGTDNPRKVAVRATIRRTESFFSDIMFYMEAVWRLV
jgi:hypothetical protein